jgi:hypothetical protein
MIHTHLFEDLPAPEIELGLEYDYYFDPGRISGPPEDCHPPEEYIEITLPDGWEDRLMLAYARSAQEAIKEIEARVEAMVKDKEPREWARE